MPEKPSTGNLYMYVGKRSKSLPAQLFEILYIPGNPKTLPVVSLPDKTSPFHNFPFYHASTEQTLDSGHSEIYVCA